MPVRNMGGRGISKKNYFKKSPFPIPFTRGYYILINAIIICCKMEEKKVFQRLPKDVVPKNYAVELTPDLKEFTFGGKLRIDAEVRKNVCEPLFNCRMASLFCPLRFSRRPLAWYSILRRLLSSVRGPKSQVSSFYLLHIVCCIFGE